MTIYAIGDLHGQLQEFERAMALIEADGGPGAEVIFLGDYNDRGADTPALLDRLIAGRDAGRNWRFLRGNHDRMFLRFVTEGRLNDAAIRSGKSWLHPALGGLETLAAYGLVPDRPPTLGVDPDSGEERLIWFERDGRPLNTAQLAAEARKAVPQAHLDFLAGTELYHETEAAIFVHAGLRPGVPMARQSEEDLLWIRAGFLDDATDHGKLVVHGHTVVDAPMHMGNRVALDTGAGYGRPITAAAFEGAEVSVLTPDGRRPLQPVA